MLASIRSPTTTGYTVTRAFAVDDSAWKSGGKQYQAEIGRLMDAASRSISPGWRAIRRTPGPGKGTAR
jgi:hypothetical protein